MKRLMQVFEGVGLVGIGVGLSVGGYIPQIALPLGVVALLFGALQLK